MADLDAIKERLAKLAKMTVDRGCSEAEALAAASKITAILEEHGLSYADIEAISKKSNSNDDLDWAFFGSKKKNHEVRWCARVIAEYFDCRAMSRTMPDGSRVIAYFGFPQDIMACMVLTQLLLVAMEISYSEFKAGHKTELHGKTIRKAFMNSFAGRISERLEEMKKAKNSVATGTALIVLKNQIVAKALQDAGVKTKTKTTMVIRDEHAKQAGIAAANAVNLEQNKTIAQNTTKKLKGE